MVVQLRKLTICNFRSYVGVTVIEDFDPGHSVFVGENGAGKTSVLQAIEYVLAPERNNSKWKDLLTILSSRKSEGYIELLLISDDGIFNSNITLRKAFSLKQCSQESFYVNEKSCSRQRVMALLEICGLMFYRPFILNAAVVSTFSHYTPEETFVNLLKRLGASAYESYIFIDKLFLTLKELKDKLDHLSILYMKSSKVYSREERNRKMNLFNEKRSIIYNILEKDREKFFKMKANLESQYQKLGPKQQEPVDSEGLKELRKNIFELDNSIHAEEEIIDDLRKEEEDLLRKHEKIILSKNEIEDELKFLQGYSDYDKAEGRIDLLRNEKHSILLELKSVERALKEKKTEAIELQARLEMKTEQRNDLIYKLENPYEPQRRETGHSLQDTFREKLKVEEDLNNLLMKKEKLVALKSDVQDKIGRMNSDYLEKFDKANQRIKELRQELNSFQENLSELRRSEKHEEDKYFEINMQLQEAGQKLMKIIGIAIIRGCESVMSVVENWKLSNVSLADSYYGMVIQNIEFPSGLNSAVETAIGSRLFSHLVLDYNVGTKILGEMKRYNLPGEAWFIPLNVRCPVKYNYPDTKNAEPILKRLKYSERFENVMQFLFGGIMVCPDLESASHVAGLYGFTTITVQGDRISRRREMFGGYFNPNRSSIKIFTAISDLQSQTSIKQELITKIKNDIHTTQSNIDKTMSNIQKLRVLSSTGNNLEEVEKLRIELRNADQEILVIEKHIDKKRIHLQKLVLLSEMALGEITGMAEVDTSNLVSQIKILNKEIMDLKISFNEANLKVIHLEQDQTKLQDKLNHQYQIKSYEEKEQAGIKLLIDRINTYNTKQSILNNRLTRLRKEIEDVKTKIINGKANMLQKKMELQEAQDSKCDYLIGSKEEISKKIRYYDNKIALRNEYLRLLKDKHNIDSLTSYQKYSKLSVKLLHQELNKVTGKIKMLESEGTRSVDGNSISIQLSERFLRLEDLFSQNYIFFGQFVEWLHDFITRNLETVSSHFTELFHRITAGGEAYLLADDDGSSDNWPALPNITGINMCVSSPNSEEAWNLLNLSQGQRISVLFALSLACVKTASVPLFIFDEIDKVLNNQQKQIINHLIFAEKRVLQTFSTAHSVQDASCEASIFSIEFMTMGSMVRKISHNEYKLGTFEE